MRSPDPPAGESRGSEWLALAPGSGRIRSSAAAITRPTRAIQMSRCARPIRVDPRHERDRRPYVRLWANSHADHRPVTSARCISAGRGCRFGRWRTASSGPPRAAQKLKMGLTRQACDLLRLGRWGVPSTAQLKMHPRLGDGLVMAVGSPDRVFVGDAGVACGHNRFNDVEAARFPSTLSYASSLSLPRSVFRRARCR